MKVVFCDKCGNIVNNAICVFCRNLFSYGDNNGNCPFCGDPAPYILCLKCDNLIWFYPYFCPFCQILYKTDGVCIGCGRRVANMKKRLEKLV